MTGRLKEAGIRTARRTFRRKAREAEINLFSEHSEPADHLRDT